MFLEKHPTTVHCQIKLAACGLNVSFGKATLVRDASSKKMDIPTLGVESILMSYFLVHYQNQIPPNPLDAQQRHNRLVLNCLKMR